MKMLEREDLFQILWKVSHNIDRAALAETRGIGSLPDGKTSRRLKAVREAMELARNIYDGNWSLARVNLEKLKAWVSHLADKEP